MIRTRFLSLLAILIASASVAFAQDDDDVVRVNTDVVVLNVTVTDKTGQYVKGLKRGDFKLYIDGVEVDPGTIAGFLYLPAVDSAVVERTVLDATTRSARQRSRDMEVPLRVVRDD